MALAFETGGYGFAPALAPVDQSALQGLKPLSFAGSGQSPVQFRPLAGWSVPSAQPELVAQGVASGLGAIAQGIQAAYQSKEAKDEKKRLEDIRAQEILDQYAHEEKIAGIKGASAMDILDKRLEEVGAKDKAKLIPETIIPNNSSNTQEQVNPRQDLPELPENYLMRDIAPPEIKDKNLGYNATEQQTNALAGLRDQLSKTDARYLTASNSSTGSMADVPSALSQTPTNPVTPNIFSQRTVDAVTNPSTLRKMSLEELNAAQDLEKSIIKSQFPEGLPSEQKPMQATNRDQMLGQLVGLNGTAVSPQLFRELKDYAKRNNLGVPTTTKEQPDGTYIIKWPAGMTEYQASRQKTLDSRLALGVNNTLKAEPKQFESEDNVKNYMGQRGLMQMLVRLSPTYEAAMKDPEHNAIPAAGMAQLMAQAETGGVPSVNAVDEYLHSQGITDTLEQLKAKYLAGGKEVLTPRQTTQMYELLLEEAKAQASLANQTVGAWQDTYRGRGVQNPEKYISPFILPKTKQEATQEVEQMIKEIAKAKAIRDKLEKSGDTEAFAAADKDYKEKSKMALDLNDKIEKTKGHIVNYHEILNQRQGFLAPVPVNALGKDAFEFMKSSEMANLNPAEQQYYMGGGQSSSKDESGE
jgi:hypothetical protein